MNKTSINRQKIAILGDSGVGKTCLVNRLVFNMYINYNSSTIGAAYVTYRVNDNFTFDIWDTAGQERFHSLLPLYLRNANIIIIIIDINQTIENINNQFIKWFSYAKNNNNLLSKNYKFCVFFNKQDTNKNFQIPEHILNNIEISYINIISAKTSFNIDKVKQTLEKLANDYMENINPNVIPNNNTNNNNSFFNLNSIVKKIQSKCML